MNLIRAPGWRFYEVFIERNKFEGVGRPHTLEETEIRGARKSSTDFGRKNGEVV
jgi:hypothetical protein